MGSLDGTTSAPGERLPVDGDKQQRREGLDRLPSSDSQRGEVEASPFGGTATPTTALIAVNRTPARRPTLSQKGGRYVTVESPSVEACGVRADRSAVEMGEQHPRRLRGEC